MLPVLLHMLKNFFKPENLTDELMLLAVENLSKMYDTMSAPWTSESGAVAAKYGRLHLVHYNELYVRSMASLDHQRVGYLLWRVYPKHHLFLHVIEDQVMLSGMVCDFF